MACRQASVHSALTTHHSLFTIRRRKAAAFTLTEMMVVVGIIGLVAAMTIPMMIPFMRGRKLDQTAEAVKTACLLARSKAIQQRRMISVTLLEAERMVIINDYERFRQTIPIRERGFADDSVSTDTLLRDTYTANLSGYYVTLIGGPGFGQQRRIDSTNGLTLTVDQPWTQVGAWTAPEAGDEYLIGGKDYKDVCPHYIGNYVDAAEREEILTLLTLQEPAVLPEGCRFDLADNGGIHEADGWTYVFLPTGGAWTLPTTANNSRDDWSETTYMSGPRLYAPDDRESTTIVVYAMTGQARSE